MKYKTLIKVLGLLIIFIFLCSYFIERSGYYEYNLQVRKKLTEEQMKQFEQDVKEGKDIKLDSYLKETTIDYSSQLTRTTSEASIKLNNYLKNIIANAFNMLGKFVQE